MKTTKDRLAELAAVGNELFFANADSIEFLRVGTFYRDRSRWTASRTTGAYRGSFSFSLTIADKLDDSRRFTMTLIESQARLYGIGGVAVAVTEEQMTAIMGAAEDNTDV